MSASKEKTATFRGAAKKTESLNKGQVKIQTKRSSKKRHSQHSKKYRNKSQKEQA